jgi:drug/metabolite transporter (DMT)-like permease
MKDLDLGTFLAVFQEMLGPLLWVLLAVAVLATLAFVLVLLRDQGLRPRRLVWSEVAGLVGGVGAVLFMQAVTHSGFADIGGPADWVLVALIFVLGAAGATVLTYAALGLARRLA